MRRTMTVIGALVALALSATPVGAVSAADATIEVHSEFEDGGGTFTTNSDLLCASGTTSDETIIAGNGRVSTS